MRREDVAIVFPGQGSQYVGMGKDLYDNFPIARRVFEEVDEAIGYKLTDIIFNGSKEELSLTANSQPAIMACSIAAYRVFTEINKASSMEALCEVTAGHSLGEYSALCAAGVFSLADTAKLVRKRGIAMQEAVPVGRGGMAALLGVDIDIATKIVTAAEKHGVCEVANDNCIGQVVISGENSALEQVELIASGYGCKKVIRLPVSAPFHCSLMQPAAEIMSKELANIEINSPIVPVVSNYTSRPNLAAFQVRHLLVGQISNMVRWRESMKTIADVYNTKKFVEIGPGKVLSGLISRTLIGVDCFSFDKITDLENIPIII